jgi:hypothetical protein
MAAKLMSWLCFCCSLESGNWFYVAIKNIFQDIV